MVAHTRKFSWRFFFYIVAQIIDKIGFHAVNNLEFAAIFSYIFNGCRRFGEALQNAVVSYGNRAMTPLVRRFDNTFRRRNRVFYGHIGVAVQFYSAVAFVSILLFVFYNGSHCFYFQYKIIAPAVKSVNAVYDKAGFVFKRGKHFCITHSIPFKVGAVLLTEGSADRAHKGVCPVGQTKLAVYPYSAVFGGFRGHLAIKDLAPGANINPALRIGRGQNIFKGFYIGFKISAVKKLCTFNKYRQAVCRFFIVFCGICFGFCFRFFLFVNHRFALLFFFRQFYFRGFKLTAKF